MMGWMFSSTSVTGSGAISKCGYVMSDKVEETSGFNKKEADGSWPALRVAQHPHKEPAHGHHTSADLRSLGPLYRRGHARVCRQPCLAVQNA